MDELTSTEFRRRYATLTQPTKVTVNGHVIGYYEPINTMTDSRAIEGIRPGEPPVNPYREVGRIQSGFNTRPFTPVPKRR